MINAVSAALHLVVRKESIPGMNFWHRFFCLWKAKPSNIDIKSFQDTDSVCVLVLMQHEALWFCLSSDKTRSTCDFVLVTCGNIDSSCI